MKPQIARFTEKTFADTRKLWIECAIKLDLPTIDYEAPLDWAEKRINYDQPNGDSLAYGMFNSDKEAVALVDIVYTRRGGADIGWLKMLNIQLGPIFSASELEADSSKYLDVINIYAQAIIGTVELTNNHVARVVKLYGRDESLLKLLIALRERIVLNPDFSNIYSAKIEGRWLVLTAI